MKKIDIRELSAPVLGLYTCILPLFSNIFSETTLPINAKFHVNPPWEVGKKVFFLFFFYVNGTGHMTKMATMPIYGKHLLKSSPEPEVL